MFFQGENEIRLIAQNHKHHFPELLGNMYDRNKYKFQHTATQGTRNSFIAFVVGDSAHTKINAEPTNDTEAFLKVCYIFFKKVKY